MVKMRRVKINVQITLSLDLSNLFDLIVFVHKQHLHIIGLENCF